METTGLSNISIMAIVNLTGDSFYSGSRTLKDGKVDVDLARSRVARALAEGASIIDLGASSSRPGSVPVGEEVEISRLEPVLKLFSKEFRTTFFSIDTTWAGVVRMAYGYLGDRLIVNDISSSECDGKMLPLVGRLGVPFVAMHGWDPKRYAEGNVVERVSAFFGEFAGKAEKYGVGDWMLDPGFGFSKTVEENWELLENLEAFKPFGRKILVGISRKSMLYKPLGLKPEDVLGETCRANRIAIVGGAQIIRVHDVKPAVDLIKSLSD